VTSGRSRAASSVVAEPEGSSSKRVGLIELVRLAFAEAAASGRSGDVMTTPVLKNRLLQLTDGAFSESDYGQASLVRLLLTLPEVVSLEGERSPYKVRLSPEQPLEVAESPPLRSVRVREDLWAACLDPSGATYVWDVSAQVPQLKRTSAKGDLILPTIPKANLDKLRATFAETEWTKSAGQTWIKKGGSIKALPPPLRNQWAEQLKSSVLQELRGFFQKHDVSEPVDLLVPVTVRSRGLGTGPLHPPTTAEGLRDFVLAAVAQMTTEELAQLQLPAAAALRVLNRQ